MREIRVERPLRLFAPAKVNLGLEILRRRADGFHDIVTVMQAVSLFDEIVLTPSDRLDFRGDARVPQQDDLAFRAIQLFDEHAGLRFTAKIRLIKRIPIAGGLGGGSSDAGALFAALGGLASMPIEEVMPLAAALGSDVPFFLRGGTALATGTGTAIEQLPELSRTWFVIGTPTVQVQNKTVSRYASLKDADLSDGRSTMDVADCLRRSETVRWTGLVNGFSRLVYAEAASTQARQVFLESGAGFVLPSGAGPSLFTVAPNWEAANTLAERVRASGIPAVVCTNLAPGINDARLMSIHR